MLAGAVVEHAGQRAMYAHAWRQSAVTDAGMEAFVSTHAHARTAAEMHGGGAAGSGARTGRLLRRRRGRCCKHQRGAKRGGVQYSDRSRHGYFFSGANALA